MQPAGVNSGDIRLDTATFRKARPRQLAVLTRLATIPAVMNTSGHAPPTSTIPVQICDKPSGITLSQHFFGTRSSNLWLWISGIKTLRRMFRAWFLINSYPRSRPPGFTPWM
jgi:hypothetical protein